MARAYPPTDLQDATGDPGEWQALRGELVSLLDQVEGRFARAAQPRTASYDGLTQRVRNLRDQVDTSGGGDNTRHREALRTVKRAVDRFSDRDEDFGGQGQSLQSAIAEIRGRQMSAPLAAMSRQMLELPQFSELTGLVTGLSGRLERLEGELKSQRASQGSVKEVANQVEQLTHVVELLAGAVGETGQVKRLEAQIAGLARLLGETPKLDPSTINKRLDDVSATVGKLAELQATQMEREVERQAQPLVAPVDHAAMVGGSVQAIENSMRNVYDRIDAIERNTTLSTGEFERLTAELAAFTQAIRHKEAVPSNLVAKIDALQARIGSIESSHTDVDGLKHDIAALRDVVLAGVEPRFARLETQLEALSVKFDAPRQDDAGIGQIEAQLKKLMARMDETGTQLTGLAELYAAEPEAAPAPDFEALAAITARRTVEAAANAAPAPMASLSEKNIDTLEQRMTAVFHTAGKDTAERLARLEATLSKRAGNAAPAAPAGRVAPDLPAAGTASRLDTMLEALSASRLADSAQNDAMPVNPAAEAPLRDPGFPPAPARAQGTPVMRKPAPVPAAAAPLAAARPAAAAPDLSGAQRPPRPQSSLDAAIGPDPFAEASAAAPRPTETSPTASAKTTSTFVAAARRAQRAKLETGVAMATSNSLIGRALARVMPAAADPGAAVVPADQSGIEKKSLFARRPKAEKPVHPIQAPNTATPPRQPEPDPEAFAPVLPEAGGFQNEVAPPAGFLSRYRRPILLAATLAAVSLLALNLVAQRLTAPVETPVPAAPAAAPAATAPATPTLSMLGDTVDPKSLPTSPRVIAMDDSAITGSINPASISTFTKPVDTTPMPPTLLASNGAPLPASSIADPLPQQGGDLPTGSIPAKPETPVKFDLAPEAVGPLELRQAAADGDKHAQFEIGAIYTEGHALPQDYKAAATWYERAAAQGFAPAQYRLGSLYEAGNGVTKDVEQAKLWYQRAADGGNRMAMHNLAALFAGGQLGEQKFEQAAEWFEQAAMLDMTDSQFNLGMLHARGLGMAQDMAQSYKWFALAARGGDADAIKARDDMAKSLSAEMVKQIKTEIDAFKPNPINLAANFAPIGTWSAKFNPGDAIASKDVVAKVQKALGKLGYDVGTPDGIAGPKTAIAIRAFEKGTGMSEVGIINPRLLAVLGSQPV